MCCDTRMNTTHTYARIHIHPCACAHMHTYTIYSSLFLPALPTGCISSICCSPHHAWLSYTWAHFPSIFQVTVGIWMLGLRTKTKRRIQISTPPAPRYLLIIGFFFFLRSNSVLVPCQCLSFHSRHGTGPNEPICLITEQVKYQVIVLFVSTAVLSSFLERATWNN